MLVGTSEILLFFFVKSLERSNFLTHVLMSTILDYFVCAHAVAILKGGSADNSRLISTYRPSKMLLNAGFFFHCSLSFYTVSLRCFKEIGMLSQTFLNFPCRKC